MADSSEVRDQMTHQGFSSREISDAFRWIEANTLGEKDSTHGTSGQQVPVRVLTVAEKAKLSPSAQGLLMTYQDRGLIDAMIIEDILERVQRSEEDEVSDKERI